MFRHVCVAWLIIALCVVLGVLTAHSQEAEKISIVQYYPSPLGVYKTVRLFPLTADPGSCDDAHRGEMYFNNATDPAQPYTCNGTIWIPLEWSSPDQKMLSGHMEFTETPSASQDGLGYPPQQICWPGAAKYPVDPVRPVDFENADCMAPIYHVFPSNYFNRPPIVTLQVQETDDTGAVACKVLRSDVRGFSYDCWANGTVRWGAKRVNWLAIESR